MGTERADVVVIGAGLAGSAAAWALASRGRAVSVIEELVLITGAIDCGPARVQEKMYESLTALGVPAELIPAAAAAAAERWPGMSFGPDPVMFHPDGGVLDPDRAMAAMRALATSRGAQFHDGTRVLRVEPREAGATVHTADQTWHTRVVIVAAGAWLEPLLGDQVPLPSLVVTQQDVFHLAPVAEPVPWPPFIYHDEITRYGRPAGGTGKCRARSRSVSTDAGRSPPATVATGSSARPPGTGSARSPGSGSVAWTLSPSAR